MDARQLYDAARIKYPHVQDVFACTSCQDADGKIIETWSVLIHATEQDGSRVLTHSGYGYTPEECLANIKEVLHERHER